MVCRWLSRGLWNEWVCEYQKYDDGNCPYPDLICPYKQDRILVAKFLENLERFEQE